MYGGTLPDMAADQTGGTQPEDAGGPPGPDFGYACPRCGDRLTQYAESCPSCGAELGDEFSVTYRVSMPLAARWIAAIALIGLLILVLLSLAALADRLLPFAGG